MGEGRPLIYTQDWGDYLEGGEELVYSPHSDLHDVYDMALDWNVLGTAGRLEETIHPENPAFDSIVMNDPRSFLQCKLDGRVFWRGTPVSDSYTGRDGFDGRKRVTFVGELSLLTDVPCPPYSVSLASAGQRSACRQYAEFLVGIANDWWSSRGSKWRFKIGLVDDFGVRSVTASSDGTEESATIYGELYSYFVDSGDESVSALGARMRLRYEDDGVYLDICEASNEEAFPLSGQPAKFKVNVMSDDFSFERDTVNQCAALEPIGAPLSQTPYLGVLFASYARLASRPADWGTSWASYSQRRMFSPLSSEPSDWNIEDGYDAGGRPLGWRRYWAMKLTSSKPSDAVCCAQVGSMWGTMRRLDWPGWGFSSAPDFLEATSASSALPDGKRAPVFWEALTDSPESPSEDEASQFSAVQSDTWRRVDRRPSDWDESYSGYSVGVQWGGALRPGHVCLGLCPRAQEGSVGSDGLLASTAPPTWETYPFVVANPVEPEHVALTKRNFRSVTGRPMTYRFNGRDYSNWDTGVDPVYKKCVQPASSVSDPVHGLSWTDSWEQVRDVFQKLTSRPSDWSTEWASYYTTAGGRDTRLYPSADMCATRPYFPVPRYARTTSKPSRWDNWYTEKKLKNGKTEKVLNYGKYSNYYVFVRPLGDYKKIEAWQPIAAKPSDFKKDKWDDIKDKYAVHRSGSFKTLAELGKKNFPVFKKHVIFKKRQPKWLAGGKVRFPVKVGDIPAGTYEVFAQKAPAFSSHARYRKRVPAFRDGAFYVERAPEWTDAKYAGKVFAQGEETAPAWDLCSSVYSASEAPEMRLDLRDAWMGSSAFARIGAPYGFEKAGRAIVSPVAESAIGPRSRRVRFEDAATLEDLAVRGAKALSERSRANASFAMSALDLSPDDGGQTPRGWPRALDPFRPGLRVPCELPTFGVDGEMLCEEITGFDMKDPESGRMRVGASWATDLSRQATTISTSARQQLGGRR